MSIFIEYGCTYDWVTEQVCHNSGPFTDNECQHDYSRDDELIAHIKNHRSKEIEKGKNECNERMAKFQPEFDEKVANYVAQNVDERLLLSNEQYHTGNYNLWLPQYVLDGPSYTIALDRNDNVFLVRYDLAFTSKYCKWVYA